MAFFGLLHEQEKSRIMFEHVFDLHFKSEFVTFETIASDVNVSSTLMNAVKAGNSLVSFLLEALKVDVDIFEFCMICMFSYLTKFHKK